jgi:death-on-curing protein
VIYLTLPELLHVAERVLGPDLAVRDHGLLESALARPRTTVFGEDAYATLETKAAALLHSVARNHALVDGNRRLSPAAAIAFLGVNGRRLTFTNDEAYELIMAVAGGEVDDVDVIAAPPWLSAARPTEPARPPDNTPRTWTTERAARTPPRNTPG